MNATTGGGNVIDGGANYTCERSVRNNGPVTAENFEMSKYRILTIAAVLTSLTFGATAQAQWATLKGQFVYGKDGTKVPEAAKLSPDKDTQVCGKEQLFNETLKVNAENRGIADVIIWAYKPKKTHPDYAKTAKEPVVLDNKNCRFEPHAVAVRTKQPLLVKNSDPVSHNSLINFLKNPGVNPMIPANGEQTFTMKKGELIPVTVQCSIHPWMEALVLVQDHPYMAVTDKDGKFELKNLPAGKLTLKVWHKGAGYVQKVDVDGKKASWKRGRYSITLKKGKDQEHTYTLDPSVFKK